MKEPLKLKNVLSLNTFCSISDELKYYARWSMTNQSDSSYSKDIAWGIEGYQKRDLVYLKAASIIKLKLCKHIKKDLKLVRIHFNGQTCGQGSEFHTDFDPEQFYTFILFTNTSWDTNWGGEFICLNPHTNEYDYTPYLPNTGVAIPSYWSHTGASPNNNTQEMRTTMAFSFIEPAYLSQYKLSENCQKFLNL